MTNDQSLPMQVPSRSLFKLDTLTILLQLDNGNISLFAYLLNVHMFIRRMKMKISSLTSVNFEMTTYDCVTGIQLTNLKRRYRCSAEEILNDYVISVEQRTIDS